VPSPGSLRRATWFALVGVAVATVAALSIEYARYQKVWDEHDPEYRRTRSDTISLGERPPPGLEECWRTAVMYTHNANCETFYVTPSSWRGVDLAAFHRFGKGFRERMSRNPGPDLLGNAAR
jgi:hypothetical protein